MDGFSKVEDLDMESGNPKIRNMRQEKRDRYVRLFLGLLAETPQKLNRDSIIQQGILTQISGEKYNLKGYKTKLKREYLDPMVEKKLLIEEYRGVGRGKGIYYSANLDVIKAFIRKYAFNGYEVKWAEIYLKKHIGHDRWKRRLKVVLKSESLAYHILSELGPIGPLNGPKSEPTPLNLLPSLLSFVFNGVRTKAKIEKYIKYFEFENFEGEIDFVGVILFEEEYFRAIVERFNWSETLNISHEGFKRFMESTIKSEFYDRSICRKEKNNDGALYFNPPLTYFMTEEDKKNYLKLTKDELLEESISFIKSVPDHVVKQYLGDDWEQILREYKIFYGSKEDFESGIKRQEFIDYPKDRA